MAGFANMTALSTIGRQQAVRRRTATASCIGEGSAVLILEEWRARPRPGRDDPRRDPRRRVQHADAHHITAPSPGGAGAVACMELALADAGLTPATSARSTPTARPPRSTTPPRRKPSPRCSARTGPPVTSIKGVTGHALGAAGALEAAAVLLSIDQHRLIPPTAGTTELDPDMRIDLVTGEPRPWTPGPTIVEQLRLRRPQRLRRHRPPADRVIFASVSGPYGPETGAKTEGVRSRGPRSGRRGRRRRSAGGRGGGSGARRRRGRCPAPPRRRSAPAPASPSGSPPTR